MGSSELGSKLSLNWCRQFAFKVPQNTFSFLRHFSYRIYGTSRSTGARLSNTQRCKFFMLSFVLLHLYSQYWFSSLYFQKCVIFYRRLCTCRRVSLFWLSFCYTIFFAITTIEFLDVKLYFMEVLAVKISCRGFQEKNINIVINNSALSLEDPELPIIQSLSL